MENNLAALLRDFAQGASNSAATNLSMPVDAIAWLLRKGGMNIPSNPVGGSDWMAERGLTPEPKNKLAGLLGDFAGFAAPLAAVTKAPQIAKGLLQAGENLAKPNTLNSQRGAIVWHGSPHKFPPTPNNPLGEFDFTKIGTGEGAQAYGHGGYLGGAKETGEQYRRALAGKDNGIAGSIAADALKGSTPEAAISDLMSGMKNTTKENQLVTQDAIDLIKSGNANSGYLYKVDLPDEHIAKMLDWDKPLSQQAPEVQRALNETGIIGNPKSIIEKRNKLYADFDNGLISRDVRNMELDKIGSAVDENALGQTIYRALGNQDTASNLLKSKGVTGIKYLDGFSRGPQGGSGSSNYVVFPGNERLLKILERNGQTP